MNGFIESFLILFSSFLNSLHGIHFDKYCFFRFKDDRHCSRLIAEALDPDCKVSPVQVSNKLKQLGLKIAPKKKKRMLQVDVPLSDGTNQLMEEARAVGEESAPLVSSNNPEGSLVRKSL